MKTRVTMMVTAAVMAIAMATMARGAASYDTPQTYQLDPPQDMIAQTGTPPVLPTSPQQLIPPNAPAFDTNGMDFTNVTFKVATGLETVSSGEAGYIQADADLWTLKYFDVGFSGNTALGAYNNGLYNAAGDVALFKNLSNFQLVLKAGVGGQFEGSNHGLFGEAGVDINYNLTAGTGLGFLGSSSGNFTYCFAGVKVVVPKFQFASNGGTFEKEVTVGMGYAF